ncbi:hypothetical protein [Nocardia amikacinitolerans]|uniref:hypothetical protein n=1 Tax=Nocardia amikacinitolerans TaxID=756689 RepID=UPI0020A50AE8|nr:hypothetical protein [Nocardia amikacinitolerans]
MQKWSLHESGDWRHQWCDPEFIDNLEDRSDRIIDQWQRPPEIGATGYTKGFSIYVRHQDVVEIPEAPQQNDVIWIPRPGEGCAVGIHIIIARPNAGQVDTGSVGLIPVAAYVLPDQRSVLVFRNAFEMTTRTVNETEQLVERAMSLLNTDMPWRPGLRLTLSGHDEHGGRFAKDIAVTQADWLTGGLSSGSS